MRKKTFKKQILSWQTKIAKKLHLFKLNKPSLEEALFAFLVIFSLIISMLFWNIWKQEESYTSAEDNTESYFTKNINQFVYDYPIQKMTPFISGENRKVASFLIAIAKKESNWGENHPEKDGHECFNYWGYRGEYNLTDSGYSCFKNPQQAVNVVSRRINELVNQKIDTPQKMVVWKCGQNCAEDDQANVAKWIEDVDLYYQKAQKLYF